MDYYKLKVLNHKKSIITVISLLCIIGSVCYYFLVYANTSSDKIVESEESVLISDEINDDGEIFVDIKGYVNKPGVYSFNLSANARINDLIIKAGGLMKDADTSTINLSKKLEDEMTIIIYSKNEIANFVKNQDEVKKKLEICETKLKNDACIKIAENKSVNNKININEASLTELMQLNGIGESKAKAIIEYREKASFKSIEEIKNVEGIGENIFTAIRENITV